MPHFNFDLKINAVNLANLVVLCGLLFTAGGTWYTMSGSVERVVAELAAESAARKEAVAKLESRQNEFVSLLRGMQEKTVDRLGSIEVEQARQGAIVGEIKDRIERALDRPARI